MTYRQITRDDRIAISVLRKEGHHNAEIARRLGFHRSSIGREIRRNSCWYDGAYRYSKAQKHTNFRRRNSRQGRRHSDEQYRRVETLLGQDYSPDQISGYLRRQHEFAISHETIYRHVWLDKALGGDLWQHLRQHEKRYRKRHNSRQSRGRQLDKRLIGERPVEVEFRLEVGHWEIDTVMGSTLECVVTLVERVTGYTLVGKLKNRTTAELNRRTIQLIQRSALPFKTITADNGTEFHSYREIEAATGVEFYFAHPYHSWERGTNENTNGLLRQYLPKGTSMAGVTQQKCHAIAKRLNDRPRKRLRYQTPAARWRFPTSVPGPLITSS